MNKYKYLLKNVGILTISNFSSKILVFLLVPLYTSVLTTEEYGIYDLLISTMHLFFPIITLNIVDAVMRFTMDESYDNEVVALIGIKYVCQSIAIMAAILFVGYRLRIFEKINELLVVSFIYFVFYTCNQFLIQLAKGHEKVKQMGIAGILGTIVMLLFNIIFLLFFDWGLKGFFWANTFSQIVPVIYLSIKMRVWKYIKVRSLDNKLEKEMLLYCTPLIFTLVGWWINSSADKYIVALICGVGANGILSVSYKIPSIINVLQSIFTQAWYISAVKEYKESNTKKFYGYSFVYLNIVMCITCSLLIMFSRPLGSFLYAKDFYVAWKYVPFLLVSSVINSASGFLGPILAAVKDSKNMAKSAIYGIITNIMFNFLLVYAIGIQGATIATVISSFIIYEVRRKAVKQLIENEKYYKIIVMWGLLIVQSIFEIIEIPAYIEIFFTIALIGVNFEEIYRIKKVLKL